MAKYRVITRGPQSDSFVMAGSAKEVCEAVAKATHDGQQVVVEDEAGVEITEEALAELVKQGA